MSTVKINRINLNIITSYELPTTFAISNRTVYGRVRIKCSGKNSFNKRFAVSKTNKE